MKSRRPLKKSKTNDFDLLQDAGVSGDILSFDYYLTQIKQDEVSADKWVKLVWETIILGQESLMSLLLNKVACLKNLNAKQRAEIIILGIAENQLACLKRLQAPINENGFAWSFTEAVGGLPAPLHAAFSYKNLKIAAWLVAPVSLQGVGVHIDKSALRAFNRDNPLDINHQPTVRYKRAKLKRSNSTLDFFSEQGELIDSYQSRAMLGYGKNGYARLFVSRQHPKRKLVVKAPLVKHEEFHALSVLAAMRNANREITMMQTINPELGFYGIKHMLDRQTGFHTSRIVMPYIKGANLFEFILDFSHLRQLILLTRCMAQTLHQVHQQDVVHGDAMGLNMKIKHSDEVEFNMDSFSVRMVDCGLSVKKGEYVGGYLPNPRVTATAPELMVLNQKIPAHESQDIYSLGVSLRVAVQSMLLDDEQFTLDDDAEFLFKLASDMTSVSPDTRISLPEVIDQVDKYLARNLGLGNRQGGF